MGYNAQSPEEIRTSIQKEAERRFFQEGITSTEMKQIAMSVGISRSTLYRHYPQKAQLVFLSMANLLLNHYNESALRIVKSRASGLDKLMECLYSYMSMLRDYPDRLRFINEFDQLYAGKYPDIAENEYFVASMQRIVGAYRQTILEGQRDGSIRTDIPADTLASVAINMAAGMAQRVLVRSEHIEMEHGVPVNTILDTTVRLIRQSLGEGRL